jgi:hypothetical protein
MKRRHSVVLGTLTVLVTLATPAQAQTPLDVLNEWRIILQNTVVGTPTPTVFYTRPYAMTGAAIFDALNSIDRVYRPYVLDAGPAPTASREAAIAQAAHDVLVALYPGSQGTLDAALAATLARLSGPGVAEGTRVGAATALAIVTARANDGWNRRVIPYTPPNLPGYYQVTPPQNAAAAFTHYPDVQPFIVPDRLRFLAAPPPTLTSELYTADFNEVKNIGGVTSTTRTAEQTSIANRWAGVGTPTQQQIVWANVLIDLARARGTSVLDTARALALSYMTQHDGLLVTMNGKFLYGLWRPVTAIRAADTDGNPATTADPTWLPLLATPPYPAYPGNMTCLAAVQARTLERLFGSDAARFSVTWNGAAGAANVVRDYNGFRELADEQMHSRIYGGIHFRFDQTASFGECIPLADYGFDNYMRRR